MSNYSNLLNDISSGNVKSIILYPTRREVKVTFKDGNTSIVPIFPNDQTILRLAQKTGTELSVNYLKYEKATASLFSNLAVIFLLTAAIFFFFRKSVDVANKTFGFINKGNRTKDEGNIPTRFEDVAGINEALEDIKEIVSFLKLPESFAKLGAKIPKGFLLVGPPGTGKTLLARAIAGEAEVPFFSLSASEFVELFIGVGASRVRALFKEAKSQSPSIIFIDEIDAIGRQRGTGIGGGNDEREQTLNQLLTEIDGFSDNSGVVILAATNRPDILDSALIRTGRFDRTINVPLPSRKGRLDILSIHARSKPLSEDVSLNDWAIRTPGFSGADLTNLLNEAAILTARRNKLLIGNSEIDKSFDRLTIGLERKAYSFVNKNRIVAYHQIGKALVSSLLPDTDLIDKITLLPSTSTPFGGNVRFVNKEEDLDSGIITKNYLFYRLIISLAGRAAEILIFGDQEITQISSTELTEATLLAREMITKYGFFELGLISSESDNNSVFLGKSLLSNQKSIAEKTSRDIDIKVINLLKYSLNEAKNLLSPYTLKLDELAELLLEEENITAKKFYDIAKIKSSQLS